MREYTIFHKEHGCPNCGFGFCERCLSLSNKIGLRSDSRKPVPVCTGCYNLLSGTGSEQQMRPKTRGDGQATASAPTEGGASKNWWGEDKLPPPSFRTNQRLTSGGLGIRSLLTSRGGGGLTANHELDDELEQRLANLAEDIPSPYPEDPSPSISAVHTTIDAKTANAGPSSNFTTSMNKNSTISDSGKNKRNNAAAPKNKIAAAPTLSELEERLAALREVPVEVIRNPRLLIVNEEGCEEDIAFADEAKRLLDAAEAAQGISSAYNHQKTNNLP